MKRNIINLGLAALALSLSFGLSGCGRSKQNAALALDEARLNISAAKSSGAQKYAAQPLKAAEEALKKGEKAFEGLRYDVARKEAQKAVMLASEARDEAERKAAEKKTAKKPVAAAKKKSVRTAAKK